MLNFRQARERKADPKQACDVEEMSEEFSSGEGIEQELYNTSGEGPEELVGS